MDKVTFLVPAYNAMKTLLHTVESMKNQTLSDFKAIIIDDGSTDGTGDYLDSIRDSRFRIVHQKNSGYVKALQRGAELVETPYFARLDADDIALPRRLEQQVRFLDSNPDVAVVGSRIGYIAGKKSQLKCQIGPININPTFAPILRNSPFWSPSIDGGTIAHSSATIRTQSFRILGGYRDLAPAEDLDLWLRFEDAGFKLGCLEEVLVLYRVTGSSESSRGHYRQLLIGRYARFCHQCRIDGVNEPTLEWFEANHPLPEERILDAKARLMMRNALGDLLEGRLLRGGIRLARVACIHPKTLFRKFRSRVF